MSKQLRLDVAQLTDVGRKRPHNEDNMAYVIPKDEQVFFRKGALFIVADGMGGHAAGEVASEIAVDTVSSVYYQDDIDDIPLSLMNAIKHANALIHQRAAENMLRSGMGTTCVAAVFHGNVAYIANVGDSRAYMLRRGQPVRQISQDHSWVEEQVRAGLLTKDQARSHAQRNVITRCLGTQAEVEVDVFSEALEVGDTFVLCSDGLSGPVPEEDLRSIISQYLPQESVYHLVERANENGGPDNITAIVVQVLEVGEPAPNASRYPVRVGASEVADESTAVLGRVASSSVGKSSASLNELRSTTAPLPSFSGPLSPEKDVVAHPASPARVSRKRRRRALVYTLAILIILALVGVSVYNFVGSPFSQSQLTSVNQLLARAKGTLNTDPANSLHLLSDAQQQLNQLNADMLGSFQDGQYTTLQQQLKQELRTAIRNYDTKSAITTLPCTNSSSVQVSTTGTAFAPLDTVVVANGNQSFTYILGNDNTIYLLTTSHTLSKQSPVSAKVLQIATDNQHLFIVSQSGTEYKLSVVKPGTAGALSSSNLPSSTFDQFTPQYMAAWENVAYIFAVSTQSNPHGSVVLRFSDTNDKLDTTPQTSTVAVSPDLIAGFAAWSNQQLFLLHTDGSVKSLAFSASGSTESSVVLPEIPAPLSVSSGQTFNMATPVPVPAASTRQLASVSSSTTSNVQSLLVSSQIDNVPHLFVSDLTDRRVLDLTALGSSVIEGSSASSSVSLQLAHQYASAMTLSALRSISTDSSHGVLDLYVQSSSRPATLNLLSVPVSRTSTCTSSS